jgi:hypothetical protein
MTNDNLPLWRFHSLECCYMHLVSDLPELCSAAVLFLKCTSSKKVAREHKLANTEHCYMQCWNYHVNITRETYHHDNVTREMYHENTAVSQTVTQIRLYIRSTKTIACSFDDTRYNQAIITLRIELHIHSLDDRRVLWAFDHKFD